MKNKKKAFTLTELLVVVIVIGILSAVVLPKFNKVVETRKTTEAEEVMAAIRTEQEQRCALNKKYANDFAKLEEIIPSVSTNNYTYSFTQDQRGIAATSKGSYNYTLKMPSYADGRICCDTEAAGNECAKLNKDYPACNELMARADYATTAQDCNPPLFCPGESTQACGCDNSGTQTRTCDSATGTWGAWGACMGTHCDCSAEGGYTDSKPCGCNNSGTQTRTCDTTTGMWGAWGACQGTHCDCVPDAYGMATSKSCNCNGTQTRSCDTSNGTWSQWSSCSGYTQPGRRMKNYTPIGKNPKNCASAEEIQGCDYETHQWSWAQASMGAHPDESACCSGTAGARMVNFTPTGAEPVNCGSRAEEQVCALGTWKWQTVPGSEDVSNCHCYSWVFTRHVSREEIVGTTSTMNPEITIEYPEDCQGDPTTYTKASDNECNANTVGTTTREGHCYHSGTGNAAARLHFAGYDYDEYECQETECVFVGRGS